MSNDLEAEDNLEIDDKNFEKYFKDVRKNTFQKGEIMAKYSAIAEFIDGPEKKQIISLLMETENKMEATAQVMRKLLFASEIDAYKVPRQMAEDLLSGMSVDEVACKPYKYTIEMFYYTKPEYMPKNDPHWCSISIIDLEKLKFSENNNN